MDRYSTPHYSFFHRQAGDKVEIYGEKDP